MTWVELHRSSEAAAIEAEQALREGNASQAMVLYAQAAEFEQQALTAVDPTKARTRGITAVSSVSLLYKASAYERAEQLAHAMLADPSIPQFARIDLRNLVQAIWTEGSKQAANVSFLPGQVFVSVKGGEVITGGARVYLEDRLWPLGPICPQCKSGERVSALGTCATRKAGYYRCLRCNFDFTIRTNTIFERSKVPLHKWVYAMYLLVTARKGISSLQLAKEIGVTQKTAWFILGRLREACGGPDGPLDKLPYDCAAQFLRGCDRGQAPHLRKALRMKRIFVAVKGRSSDGSITPILDWREVMKNVPEVLDKMVDAVLAYRPKPKSKAAKKRARKAKKKAKS